MFLETDRVSAKFSLQEVMNAALIDGCPANGALQWTFQTAWAIPGCSSEWVILKGWVRKIASLAGECLKWNNRKYNLLPLSVKSSLFRIFGRSFSFCPEKQILESFTADGAAFKTLVSSYFGWNFTRYIDEKISVVLKQIDKIKYKRSIPSFCASLT